MLFRTRASTVCFPRHCDTLLLDQAANLFRDRISELEMLDEVEELDLVLAHYAISWGTKDENEATAAWGLTSK